MAGRLGSEKNSSDGGDGGGSRNGRTDKTAPLENQETAIEAPAIGTERLNRLSHPSAGSGRRYPTVRLY
jgi:hypothetical protein